MIVVVRRNCCLSNGQTLDKECNAKVTTDFTTGIDDGKKDQSNENLKKNEIELVDWID